MRNTILLIGLMRSPAQLQHVVTIELSTHAHFPTAALTEGIVQPAELVPPDKDGPGDVSG